LNSPNRVVIAAVKTQRLGRPEIHIGAVADKPNAQEIEEKLVPPGIRRAHRRAELDKGRVAADAGLVDRSGIGKRPAFARLKRQRQVASALRAQAFSEHKLLPGHHAAHGIQGCDVFVQYKPARAPAIDKPAVSGEAAIGVGVEIEASKWRASTHRIAAALA